ncbi:melanoma antigen preferentially expressed in tumors-like [Suncus etruscus]|uniref:melanoma antigen preferentially expressed in tumors-like n=1 Tax=Suncus etruscus TaxID=109475 RepID=UPI0021101B48|nr:melanoma antigen preferentially expressed in tumors-like [Suncus etruscus]
MDQKAVPTLLELAMKSLLTNEPAAIQALDELPRDIFVPLFTCAFLGRKKEMLKSMVKVWPFYCLHIGRLTTEDSTYKILKAMVDGLHLLPAQNSYPWGSKLRVLDLRQDYNHGIVCTYRVKYPFCSQSCAYAQHSNLKLNEAQPNLMCVEMDTSESEPLPVKEHIELLIDISFNSTLRTKRFLSFLKSKIEQSYGCLHLCCRNLQLDNLSAPTNSLQVLDPACIDHLEVNEGDLKKVTTLLPQLIHLNSLSFNDVPFKLCKGKHFRNFVIWLGKLNNLNELKLSFFCLRNQLHKLLRVLPPQLETLSLSCCYLSTRDIIFLSQSSQVTQLKLLNLSHNQMLREVCEPLKTMLERVSGTVQHLELNNCHITNSTLSVILPALSHCSCLQVFSFNCNPITIRALIDILQYLTALTELKHVIYPIPIDCYEQWDINGILNQQKLVEVQTQLKLMLQEAKREDMYWTAFPQ